MPVQGLVRATTNFLSFRTTSGNKDKDSNKTNTKDENNKASLEAAKEEWRHLNQVSRLLVGIPLPEDVNYYTRDEVVVGKQAASQANNNHPYYDWLKIKRLPDGSAEDSSERGGGNMDSSMNDSSHRQQGGRRGRGGGGEDEEGAGGKHVCYYTLKQVLPKFQKSSSSTSAAEATLRLLLECQYLARLSHENIIKVKGQGYGGEHLFLPPDKIGDADLYFMVTERVVESLQEKLDRWRKQPNLRTASSKRLSPTRTAYDTLAQQQVSEEDGEEHVFNSTSRLYRTKLNYARDLASALEYLHAQNLVVVNLSPATIGFMADGTIQITDLSCVMELDLKGNKSSGGDLLDDSSHEETATATTATSDFMDLPSPALRRTRTQPLQKSLTHANPDAGRKGAAASESIEPPTFGRSQSQQVKSAAPPPSLAPPAFGRSKSQQGAPPTPAFGRSKTTEVQTRNSNSALLSRTQNFRVLASTSAESGDIPRYVAPEIITNEEYSTKADSYSWALIFFELLTLSKPYASYKTGQHFMKVCVEGSRPNTSVYKLPKEIDGLLYRSWRQTVPKRIHMDKALTLLPHPNQRRARITVSRTETSHNHRTEESHSRSPEPDMDGRRSLGADASPSRSPEPESRRSLAGGAGEHSPDHSPSRSPPKPSSRRHLGDDANNSATGADISPSASPKPRRRISRDKSPKRSSNRGLGESEHSPSGSPKRSSRRGLGESKHSPSGSPKRSSSSRRGLGEGDNNDGDGDNMPSWNPDQGKRASRAADEIPKRSSRGDKSPGPGTRRSRGEKSPGPGARTSSSGEKSPTREKKSSREGRGAEFRGPKSKTMDNSAKRSSKRGVTRTNSN